MRKLEGSGCVTFGDVEKGASDVVVFVSGSCEEFWAEPGEIFIACESRAPSTEVATATWFDSKAKSFWDAPFTSWSAGGEISTVLFKAISGEVISRLVSSRFEFLQKFDS
jgi:hypothetical protein